MRKVYETQNLKKNLKGKTNFYMDRTKGKKPLIPKFRVKNLPNDFPEDPTPNDCFSFFFNDKLWQYIANQTNLFTNQQRRVLNSEEYKNKNSKYTKIHILERYHN